MKKAIFSLFILALCFWAGRALAGPVKVVATTELVGSLVKEVGGDGVEVFSVVKGGEDPRYVNPRRSLCVHLNKADLVATVGQGLEGLWLPELVSQCRNPRVEEGKDSNLDLSKGAKILPLPQAKDAPQGLFSQLMGRLFVGPQPGSVPGMPSWGNPYYWLDPANGEVMAKGILEKLVFKDPANADQYQTNYQEFTAKLHERMGHWDRQMEPLRGVRVAAYSIGWAYLAERHGLKIVGLVESPEGRKPGSKQRAALIESMKAEGVRFLLMAPYQDQRLATDIFQKANTEALVLPISVDQAESISDYLQMFEVIYQRVNTKLAPS
jgi:zinc/manganese transport system substrate-binding protein